jgi:hypothetical protein
MQLLQTLGLEFNLNYVASFDQNDTIYRLEYCVESYENIVVESYESYGKDRKWHFRDPEFKNFLGPSALAFSPPQSKRASYGPEIT